MEITKVTKFDFHLTEIKILKLLFNSQVNDANVSKNDNFKVLYGGGAV